MTIRVLHVLDKISVDSGVSSFVMNYYEKLDHSRITFDFMLNEDLDGATRARIESNGSDIHIMPALKLANTFKYIKALRVFYQSHDYKIIHGHVANSAVFYLGLAGAVSFRILHSHSTKPSDIFWKRIRNWILTRFTAMVANRYAACSKEAAIFLFGSKRDVTIFRNAIDVDKYSFSPGKRKKIRSELGLSDEYVIGHVGRFSAVKNHKFLLDAFSVAYQKNLNLRLLLIGDGDLQNGVRQRATALGVADAVYFTGIRDNVCDYMSAMDIFALPSLFEGYPLAAVEAQASGLPVIVSKAVTGEINLTGSVYFLDLDKDIWADNFINAYEYEKKYDRIKKGAQVGRSQLNIETQVERLCRYYERLSKDEL